MASISLGLGALLGGVAGAGGSIFGSINSSNAAEKAAQEQENEADQALAFQKQIFNTQQQNQAPFLQAGTTSIGTLMQALKNGTFGPGSLPAVPQFTGTFAPPTLQQAEQTPGFEFTREQGDKGILEASAAAGGAISGGTAKSLDQYNTGLASTTYQQQFQNALNTYQTAIQRYGAQLQGYQTLQGAQQQEYGQLYNPAALGEGAVQSINNTGTGVATNVGNLMAQIGNAQASGTVGSANAINTGISGVTGAIQNGLLLSQILRPQAAPGGTGPTVDSALNPLPYLQPGVGPG